MALQPAASSCPTGRWRRHRCPARARAPARPSRRTGRLASRNRLVRRARARGSRRCARSPIWHAGSSRGRWPWVLLSFKLTFFTHLVAARGTPRALTGPGLGGRFRSRLAAGTPVGEAGVLALSANLDRCPAARTGPAAASVDRALAVTGKGALETAL